MHNGSKQISTIEKTAIFLLSLGEDMAAELLQKLPEHEARRILQTMSRLGRVDQSLVLQVQQEFHDLIVNYRPTHFGDADLTKRILSKAFNTEAAAKILNHVSIDSYQSFKEAENLDGKSLHQIIEKELPQTIAVILAHLSPKKSGEVLAKFSVISQSEILLRMASLQEVNQSMLEEIDETLSAAIEVLKHRSVTQIGGVDKTAALLATLSQGQREEMLAKLAEKQPELAESIRSQLWTFEDLAKLQPSDIEKILRKISATDLELALRKASDTVKARVFKCMSERRAQDLKENIALAKPVAIAKIEDAQRRIATLAAQMISDGEISDPTEQAV